MSARRLLLITGVFFIVAGLGLAILWATRPSAPPSAAVAEQERARPAVLSALRALPSGTLLREGEIGWREIDPRQIRPGQLLRGEVSETEFLGAITRRDFGDGEPLLASELVKPSDRRFLAAVLRPGHRAVSISADAPQSASGLVLPGDFVDVILTQNFGDNVAVAAQRSVGETVLQNVRVVALDQLLGPSSKPADGSAVPGAETRLPKTITLEVSERQAQILFVAMQLGTLQLAVRPLEGSGLARSEEGRRPKPTWASDVSRAIAEMSVPRPRAISSGSSVESAVRRPPGASP